MTSKPFRTIRTASIALIAATLAACSVAPTPYQAEGEDGGFTDQQIEADRYRVKFAGNSATPRETVEDYVLYRAAELTLQTGNDYFEVVSREVEPVIGSVRGITPGIGIGIGSGGNVGFGISTVYGGGQADYSYVAYMDILVHEGEVPEDNLQAYAAFDVIERLQPTITGIIKVEDDANPAPEPSE
ncbi:MAG: CC0125/CC1285 family lipoprotein [Geminicoccaceae bacterium]